MCLRKPDKPIRPVKKGYVIRQRREGGLSSIFNGLILSQQRRKWLEASIFSSYRAPTPIQYWKSSETYPAGWHVFHCFRDTIKYAKEVIYKHNLVILEAKVKGVLATGFQESHPYRVTVCEYIKLGSVRKEH